jgi:DNA uptake protein ComE-like DNA-binding protein
VKLFSTKSNKEITSRRDDAFHLASIIIVILLSLLAWGVESMRTPSSKAAITDFLEVLNTWPIYEKDHLAQVRPLTEPKPKAPHSKPSSTFKRSNNSNKYYTQVINPEPFSLDLNILDSSSFEMLPVFGPVLSGRTVRYRQILGGFVNVNQLQEVYGIDEDSFNKVAGWFIVDPKNVVKICVDTASWSQMRSHPYFGVDGARMIERYRRHHEIKSIDDLKLMPLMNDSIWNVWSPYIKVITKTDLL